MDRHSSDLRRFAMRVRLVRAWKGLAVGACMGAVGSAIWAALDWANLYYASWLGLADLVCLSGLLGLLVGALLPLSRQALGASIDRRAQMEDRLVTSMERSSSDAGFDAELHRDADSHLHGLRPSRIYPVRVGRWQMSAIALSAIASAVFLLGNSAILLSDRQKQDRKELQQKGVAVERVLKPMEQNPKNPAEAAEDKKLEDAVRRLAKELEKSRISKEEAMQRANELQKQAEKLVRERADQAQKSLEKAESASEMLKKTQLQKAGLDAQNAEAMSKANEQEQKENRDRLDQQLKQNQQQIDELQRQLAKAGKNGQLKSKLSAELQKLLANQKALQFQLKLSKEVQDMLQRMVDNPLYKQLMEMQAKLAEAMKDAKQNGSQRELTQEDLEKMQQALEQLAKQLKDDKAMEAYLKALLDALKDAKSLQPGNGVCLGLGGLFNPFEGAGAPTPDTYFANTGQIHKSDKPEASRGKTNLTSVSGEIDPTKEGGTYIEIKGPATLGGRSSVAYTRDVLSYKRKAEQAINRKKIPKDQEQRVKAYFDSLHSGK